MMAALRFRELPAMVPGKTDCFMADPRLLIVDAEYNCRDMTSAETLAHIDWLADEIENTGFNPEMPLTVRRRGDDTVIVRGHCRHAALLKLIDKGIEVKGVPVMQIAAGTSDIDLIFDQEASNYGLRLDPLARARLVFKAKKLGVSDDEIIKRMHWKSAASIKQHLEMLEKLPEDIKQRVRDGKESATLALKLQKEDPAFAEQLRRENEEQNKKLGVGSRPKKLTQKTVTRAKAATAPKADPKPPAEPKPEAKPETETAAPIQSLAQLQDKIKEITGADGTKPEGFIGDEMHEQRIVPLGSAFPGEAPIVVGIDLASGPDRYAETAMITWPRPINRVEKLLLGFMNADAPALALQYATLRREYEETVASSGEAMQGQEELCVAADVIGQLRFPDDWENAKATAELSQVAA